MAKKVERGTEPADQSQLIRELQDIKNLLMVLALKIGTSTNELGAALGVSGQRIRQMIPASGIKKLRIGNEQAGDEG